MSRGWWWGVAAFGASALVVRNRAREPWRRRLVGGDPEDGRLTERIRSRLGHVVSNPRAVELRVVNGRVALEGTIASAEVERLLAAIRSIPGVRGIANGLVVHVSPEPSAAPSPVVDWIGTLLNAPGSRAVMGIIGAAAAFYGVARLNRRTAPAASDWVYGPTAPRARRGFMTPRALALLRAERRTTMA